MIEALRKIQDIQLRKGEYCVCGRADSEASTRADGEDYVQMNYSDWAALSQYICVQDEKIKQLETELDSVIELSSIDQRKRSAGKAKEKETPSRMLEKAQQISRMKTTVAVIQKPEKILETASLYGTDERRIRNKVKMSSDKEVVASPAKQRSTTTTPDDREKAAPTHNARALQKSLTMRGGLHDPATRS